MTSLPCSRSSASDTRALDALGGLGVDVGAKDVDGFVFSRPGVALRARRGVRGLDGHFGFLLGSSGGMPDAGPWDAMPTSEGAGVLAQTGLRRASRANPLLPRVHRVHRRRQPVFGHAADRVDRRGRRRRAARRARRRRSARAPSRRPPPRNPGGGLPIPTRTRTKSGVPRRWMMLRTPLLPAWPPPHLEAHVAPRQIELVVDDDHVRQAPPSGRPRRAARCRPTGS